MERTIRTLASISPTATITYGPDFVEGQVGSTETPGSINDTGGYGGFTPTGSAPQLLFTIPVTATAAGTETFTPSLPTTPGAELAVYDSVNALTPSQITFVPATVTIEGTQPIIVVSGNGQSIADGSSTPSAAQGTDFGLRQVGGNPLVETYTIANNGSTPLAVGSVSLGGANPGDFSVTAQPAATVAAGSSTTFSVQFVAGAVGARTATVSFSQNDPSQGTPFTFAVGGEGTTGQLVVTGLGQAIGDGDLTTSAADGTDFGRAPPGNSPVVETFDLTNTGTSAINLSSITVGGTNAGDFTVAGPTSGVIAPGATQAFSVGFLPLAGASGERVATVSIGDDDSSQPNPFTFAIGGTAQFPAIAVSGDGTPIDAGDTTTSALDATDFGTQFANTVNSGVGHLFTITNHGSSTLTIGQVTLAQNAGGSFSVSQQPAQTLGPGAATTFAIAFHPTALGTQTAVVNFAQSDPGQVSPFTFAVSGTGLTLGTSDLVTVEFETTDSSGNVLTSVPTGTAFQLRAVVQDNSGRGVNGGVFETYLNAAYNPSLVSIPSDAANPVVTFGTFFINGQTENTQTAGELVDTGAFGEGSGPYELPPGSAPQPLFSIPVTASAAGVETFTPEFLAGDVAVFGDDSPLTASQVTFVPATIQITGGQSSIAVSGGGQAIVDGSTTPDPTDDTDFGAAAYAGAPVSQTYTISNSGTGVLTIGNLVLGGANPGDFTITSPPATTVAPGGSTTFSVQFAPTALGTRAATISFDENDPTQSDPFTFAIQGEALPGLSITDPQVTVPNDSTSTTTAVFTVSLSTPGSQTVTVDFATADGTAVAGTDYQATSGTLTFAPGVTSQTVSVTVPGTLYAEPTKEFSVVLSQATSALITAASATGTLVNNNVPSWTNPVTPNDVNGDNATTPIDALVVINFLNTNGQQPDPPAPDGQHYFLDTNDSGTITPLDALSVINQVNSTTSAAQAALAAARAAVASPVVSASPAAAPAVAGAVSGVAGGTTGTGTVAAPPSAAQLADVAMAVYNAEDLALAAASFLPTAPSGGRHKLP